MASNVVEPLPDQVPADDFQALEEKIYRTIEMYKAAREAYNLRGSDPEYILRLAEYVDSKMRAVAAATNTIDTVRLAVLAALNIADEFHVLQKRLDSGATDYQKRAHQLVHALDEVFKESSRAV